ncbi:putative uncharacterized protein [Clostridium sp. CAG:122]|uniref:peptidoglycan recognition protein family protein n=1 Tax=Butyribacter TaxID=2822463 RepID=UPI000335A617|nr:putative uncharacterized protein [Clostridium sp. CAG:122]
MKKLSKAKRRRRMKVLRVSVLAAVIAVLVVVGILAVKSEFLKERNSDVSKINLSSIKVPRPKINVRLLTENINSRPGIALRRVRGIVIHYTANPGTDAMANRNYFESRKNEEDSSKNKVSSHFIIGLHGQIIQCIPLNEISYASNNRNSDTISIECCHPDKTGKFSRETYKSLIKLTGWLCTRYDVSKSNLIRHYDVTGKLCPLYYVKHKTKWRDLKNDIWFYIMRYRGKAQ